MTEFTVQENFNAVIAYYGRFFVLTAVMLACGSVKDTTNKQIYEGPIMSLDSVNTVLSDSGLVVLRKQAPKEDQFGNRDVEWASGLSLQYFDKSGRVSSTFKSDYAYYTYKKNIYKGSGDVVVRNVTNGNELTTEELYWNPKVKQFYTEKFVTIRTEDEIHTGDGLTANQDFSEYTIIKPSGIFPLKESVRSP